MLTGFGRPCLTYGLRGVQYYSLEISGPGQDLHSGAFGGSAQEPMTDLTRVMASLVDTDGKIQIPGIADQVAPVTKDEQSLYGPIAYTMDDLFEAMGSKTSVFEDKQNTLMARWYAISPSFSTHKRL